MKNTLFVSLIMLFTLTGMAHAALIASDSFATTAGGSDYNVDRLYGQNPSVGVTGFTTAWGNSNNSSTSDLQVENGGLSHALMTGTALAGQGTTASTTADRSVFRALPATLTTGTYYFSLLLNSADNVRHTGFGLSKQDDNGNNADAGSMVPSVLIGINDSNLYLYYNGNTQGAPLVANFTAGETYLALVQLDLNTTGTDVITASIYGTSDTNFNLPLATRTDSGVEVSSDLSYLAMVKGDLRSTTGTKYDEFRLSTELSDVITVIPEPSALALIGLSSLALILFRHRRR